MDVESTHYSIIDGFTVAFEFSPDVNSSKPQHIYYGSIRVQARIHTAQKFKTETKRKNDEKLSSLSYDL